MLKKQEIIAIYERNVDAVYRISLSYLKKPEDAEDIVQGTFLKMIEKQMIFENQNHERGWLILTASNLCKNHLNYWFNKKRGSSQYLETAADTSEEEKESMALVLNLPHRYKMPIYLYYYEGFSTQEIAEILKKSPSTVRTQLERGRKKLKELLEEENHEK